MKFISVIPARKNSKGIKNKNIFKINKKPMIEYSFIQAKKSNLKLNFVVTDSEKIKKLSKKYSINSEYVRPKKLSGSKVSLSDTLFDFYKWTLKKKIAFEYLVVLQPTSPLRLKKDINSAIKIIKKEKSLSLFSISHSIEHPYETIKINKNKFKHVLEKSKKFFRRQDFDLISYFINGAIYIIHKNLIKKKKIYDNKNHSFYLMPKTRSLEINDLHEAKIIESIIKNKIN
tara:strand:- start:1368 stop:2057 length:690 start_codon:yes stop_codon:yes gene_type:complete